jgi:prolyl-tRNA synthetase
MRGREFLMKDAYSFDVDEAGAKLSYNRMFVSYLRIFARMGLKAIPMRAETGPIGGDHSHEFIILADTGESAVFINKDVLDLPIPDATIDYDGDLTPIITQWTTLYAATEDVHDAARFEAETPEDKRINTRGIEVGQVFYFGDKYSKPMKSMITGPDGVDRPFEGGSYGVGVSRLLGAIIEASHDDKGIIWPESVAPFTVGLANLKVGDEATDAACEKIYAALTKADVDVLYDDTDDRPGGKFAKLDLIGLPYQIIVGPKGVTADEIEVKTRATGARETLPLSEVIARFTGSTWIQP